MKNTITRLLKTEPALIRGFVVTCVAIAAVWGFDISVLGDQVNRTIDLVFTGLVPVITALWIRGSVYSPATVEKMGQ